MNPTHIGEFEVLSRIGGGGMADVYRCRRRGIGGFEKILAVKRIRSERASDPEFVSLFLDEARLAANLNHPNIVQLFEMGEADGAPFIAMEYVPGPTLARLMRKMRRHKRSELRHVAGHMARILADVCEALHHAHTARGPDGEPMGLVHGDVSPQNIIVTRQGLPKLLDFGVAKASSRVSEVQACNLKGKLKYMAPEQLMGKVDHRSDLFAVGVCFFEATVGRSPFGPDDADQAALFTSIAEGRFLRPSDLVAFYPRALEDIVLAAIEPDLSKRCQSALELHDRLEEFVESGPYPSNTRAVADWVNELFPEADESTPPMAWPRRKERPRTATVLAAAVDAAACAGKMLDRLLADRAPAPSPRSPWGAMAGFTRHRFFRRFVPLLGGAAVAAAGVVGGGALVRTSENQPFDPPANRAADRQTPDQVWRSDRSIRTGNIPTSTGAGLGRSPREAQSSSSPVRSAQSDRPRKLRRAIKALAGSKVSARRAPAAIAPPRSSLVARSVDRTSTKDPTPAPRPRSPAAAPSSP
jgi:tRNA A-37 threonylcarbamoyl transferase component Bud32